MIPIFTIILAAFLYGVYHENKELKKKKANRTCANCKHLLSFIGIGKGLKCGNRKQPGKWPSHVPSFNHSCSFFEEKFAKKGKR